MREELVDVIENLGWSIYESEFGDVELSQYSPAGEDFSFSVMADTIIEDIKEYAAYFDPEEHVRMWVQTDGRVPGVPDIFTLCQDAKDIDKMLQDLAAAVAQYEEV